MQTEGWIWLGIVTAATGATLAWLNRDILRRQPNNTALSQPVIAPVSLAQTHTKLPQSHLPVMAYPDLVTSAGVGGLIREIQEKFGFAHENYSRDVVPVLQQFSEFVQLLPASESHHHAQPGGLLIHLLEVARNALLLPPTEN